MLILKTLFWFLAWLFVLTPIAIVVKLFSFTLGWLFIAPSIWLSKDGKNYPEPWRTLFQPDDSWAIGDDPAVASTIFQDREGVFTKDYPEWKRNYVLAVMWSCMRNPGYGWDALVGCAADVKIVFDKGLDISFKRNWKEWIKFGADIDWGYGPNEEAIYTTGIQFIVADTGHWNLRFAFVIPFTTRGFLVQLGWNLRGGVVNSNIRNLKIDIAGKSTVKNKI